MENQTAYQYLGMPGISWECLYSVRLILSQAGYFDLGGQEMIPKGATLITNLDSPHNNREHAFVFWDWILQITIVPSGFRSGYGGAGPTALALALLMLTSREIPLYELEVEADFFERLDSTRLTETDIAFLNQNGRRQRLSMPFTRFIEGVAHPYLTSNPREAFTVEAAQWPIQWEWLDSEVAKECQPLARNRMDRALHQGFIILKDRLAHQFNLPATTDGTELVNQIFGKDGPLFSGTTDQVEQKDLLALRDLLSGMFRVFRNKYAHHNVKVSELEAHAVLSMISFLLRKVSDYKIPTSP